MKGGTRTDVRRACAEFVTVCSEFYKVPACGVRVLAARPLIVRESWATELFGDYNPSSRLIRVWMKTAVRKEITSFGTFLSTLCHEFCHHLDYQNFGFPDSWHTRGFYEQPPRYITMREERLLNGCFGFLLQADAGRIDWLRANRGS
jgi:hypothetical protein